MHPLVPLLQKTLLINPFTDKENLIKKQFLNNVVIQGKTYQLDIQFRSVTISYYYSVVS